MAMPIVTVTEGQLQGKAAQDYLGGTYYSFSGIPYGKAPIGPLRFKAPQPVESWDGIRDATKEGPECPSMDLMPFSRYMGSEDNCLNLNIYTPELPTEDSKLKPVMVWIHGGGFLHGSNKTDIYGPDYLITEDIVLVCINYRLGVLGFLCLENPTLEVSGNAGLKDMVLALKWVQKNIKHFCGDPNNVTIFGESAGGASVHYLYVSPMAKGLFHKAIAQSGCALNCWAQGSNSNVAEIAKNLGYEETDEKKILDHLQSLPVRKIIEAQMKTPDLYEPRTVRPFGPVVEKISKDAFLTESPIDIIRSGSFNDVPLMMGYTSREGMLFVPLEKLTYPKRKKPTNFENEVPYDPTLELGSKKSLEKADKIKNFYYGQEKPSEENIDNLNLIKTDNLFLHGIHNSVTHQKLKSKSPIFFYKMTLETSLNIMKNIFCSKYLYIYGFFNIFGHILGDNIFGNAFKRLANLVPRKNQPGVGHADDLFYLFKTIFSGKLDPESPEGKHVRRFVKLWTNFARYGNPTPDADDELLGTTWKPVTKEENWLLNIGEDLKMEIDPDVRRVEFWNDICQ